MPEQALRLAIVGRGGTGSRRGGFEPLPEIRLLGPVEQRPDAGG